MFTHILLPTDGSELAARGVEQGIALAARLGAKVTLVTVTEPLNIYVGPDAGMLSAAVAYPDFDKEQAASAQAVLDKVRRQAETAGVPTEALHIPRASPADSILETARSRGCDLIVMASHGRRGFRRLMLGSQTAEVLARSTVPVLVTPRGPAPS